MFCTACYTTWQTDNRQTTYSRVHVLLVSRLHRCNDTIQQCSPDVLYTCEQEVQLMLTTTRNAALLGCLPISPNPNLPNPNLPKRTTPYLGKKWPPKHVEITLWRECIMKSHLFAMFVWDFTDFRSSSSSSLCPLLWYCFLWKDGRKLPSPSPTLPITHACCSLTPANNDVNALCVSVYRNFCINKNKMVA